MGTGSLRLGSWFGIRVHAHWSVLVIGLLLVASLTRSFGLGPAVVAVVSFLVSILLHELAHALTARRFGVGTESIQLWALGGVARLDREAPTARAEGWIAAAGPIASVLVAVASVGLWWAAGGRSVQAAGPLPAVVGWLGVVNAAIALFNLLPGAPLDGGRIVKAVRWARHGDRHRAAREAGRAGVVIGWSIGAVGLWLMMRSGTGAWLLVTGVFIGVNARVEIAGAALRSRLDGVVVGDLTWYGVAEAGTDMDADSMLWDRRRLGGAGGVVVTDDHGLPHGVVLEDDLWSIPADERPWVLLTQLMVPVDRTARAAPGDELSSVLPRLDPARPILTVWDRDRLVGLVPPQRLRETLRTG